MRILPLVPALAVLCSLSAQANAPFAAEARPTAPAAAGTAPASPAPVTQPIASHAVASQPQTHVMFDRQRPDAPLWAAGTAWKASFDPHGFTAIPFFGSAAPQNYPLRFELAQATVGGMQLVLADGEPFVDGSRVSTRRGALTEVIDADLDHLEQSFVFDTLPNRGAIGVDVNITTGLTATAIAGGLRFANEFGHVDYTHAVAIDAAGRRSALAITWNGSAVHLEIPASFVVNAQLPIVLDPVLNFWYLIASGQTQLQHDSDVASFQSLGGRTLIVYQRNFSASDTDVWGVMFDGSLNLVQTDFSIDFTLADWTKVAVAASNYAQNFLVVAEIRIGGFPSSLYYIGGRTIAANATPGSVFDIERDGVVGIGGNNFQPDVGSDPYFGVGRYTVVFLKSFGVQSGIYMRQITTNGGQVTANPVAIDVSSAVNRPAISKSCGQSNGLPAYWLVTWQRTYQFAPFDQDAFGRFVNWNGALPGAVFNIAFSGAEETAPSPSSPFDANGVRYWPACFESAAGPGQPRDVLCRVFRSDATFVNGFTMNSAIPGADDRDPEIDSDGTRFVACWTTGTSGNPQSVAGATWAYLPATNTFRHDDAAINNISGLDNYGECNVCADYSGGNQISPRYFISFSEKASNTFRLENYGGWLTGTLFGSRPSQCGVTVLHVSGSPVIGQTLTFDVQPGPLAAVHIGTPAFILLNPLGCNCFQGVDPIATFLAPWTWSIPIVPAAVGLDLSAQGFHLTGTQCLGFIDLSDTIDFKIR